MENISSCIQQTVGILAHLANQQQTPYQQQYRPLLAHPALINNQSRIMDTLPREMSKMKIRGMKKTREFMKRTTIVLISTSSDIYNFTLQVIL